MDEISVLDYVKFKLNPKNFGKEILPEDYPELIPEDPGNTETGETIGTRLSLAEKWLTGRELVRTELNPLFMVFCLLFALAAQIILEPTITARTQWIPKIGGGLYFLSAACFCFAFILRKKTEKPETTPEEPEMQASTDIPETITENTLTGSEDSTPDSAPVFSSTIRYEFLSLSAVCALLAFLLFGGNKFTFLNISVWILSLLLGRLAFSSSDIRALPGSMRTKISDFAKNHFRLKLSVSLWDLVWLTAFACCVFFLFFRLDSVPVDMVSDHAEKLYDIKDILDGKSPIFFSRNTGRECFQFYFTVLIIKIFGTGLSFLSLKIGTALAGLFILPFVYKLGKMLGNRWVGLIAMLLSGISYWPIVIGRAALRFSYYPMFTAPALYFLIRGLKERDRNNLIWSGIFLGLGLHGYSPFRIVPIAFAVFFIIYLLLDVKAENRTNALQAFLCLIFFAFLVFLPLARVTLDMPEMVIYRSVSRLGETEKSFDSAPLGIFASNVWKGIVMPFWSDGSTWVHSIVYRPALEHLTASFFFIGLLFVPMRFLQKRSWADLCMILSIPFFMLPSTLSLAFPAENPCLNRTAGALIPVMIIASVGFCCIFDLFAQVLRRNTAMTAALCVITGLFLLNIISHNYDLIFKQYAYEYNRSAWNTTQIGEVIKGFANSFGSYKDAYVVPYPHWVDTRLVGINAGDPGKDYSFDKSLISSLPDDGHPRLFIYRDDDTEAADTVRARFPNGIEQLHIGPYSGKNFYSYIAFCSELRGQ